MLLSRIERINHSISIWFERAGILALLVMLAVTCVDVIGTKCFRRPILGAIDIVTLSQVIAIAFTISIAQIAGRHIRVEFLFSRLSDTAQAFIDIFIYFIQSLFFALVVWRLVMFGRSLQNAGEVSATLFIPLYPFIFALALGFVPICLLCLLKSISALMKVIKR
jgi:TRAP-type C4-dicarboxylate transport system permease small subunit